MENHTVFGKVIQRNFIDVTIVLKLTEPRTNAVVNLTCWLQNQPNGDLNLLPHTKNMIKVQNVKFIRSCTEERKGSAKGTNIEFYIGNASTIIEDLGNPEHLLDDFVACADMLQFLQQQHNCDLNLLDIIKQNNLTEKHVEVYICFPNVLPKLQAFEAVRFAMFNALSEKGIMKHMRVQNNMILLNDDRFIIHSVTTMAGTIPPNSKMKSTLIQKENIVPYFGNVQSKRNECLVGILTSRLGKLRLEDDAISDIVHMNCARNSDVLKFNNCLVLIDKYHIVSEIYNDGIVECLLVDIKNVRLLLSNVEILFAGTCGVGATEILFDELYPKSLIVNTVDELPSRVDEYVQYTFVIEAIAPLNKVACESALEVWLIIHLQQDGGKQKCFLSLGSQYLSTVAFLDVGRTYHLHSRQKLNHGYNPEVKKFAQKCECFKLNSPEAYFLPVDNAPIINIEIMTMPPRPGEAKILNVKATLSGHYLNDSKSFRQVPDSSFQLGMLARKHEHRLNLEFSDGSSSSMFCNIWETKQTPEGLHPKVILLITHAYFTGKYFSSNFFTNIKAIGVTDVLQRYATANFNDLSTAQVHHESVLTPLRLDLKYFMYLRTKVYVHDIDLSVNMEHKMMNMKVITSDENLTPLLCSKFELLFKFMELPEDEIEEYCRNCHADITVEIGNISSIVRDENIAKILPVFVLWIQRMNYRFTNLLVLDVLCKSTLEGGWVIEDVYKVE